MHTNKFLIVLGAAASVITIVSFVTGMFSLPEIISAGTHSTRLDSSPRADGAAAAGSGSVLPVRERFRRTGKIILFLLTLAMPLLPSAGFYKLAYELDWDIDFETATYIVTGVVYLLSWAVSFAFLFPSTSFSGWVWSALE